MLMGTLKAVVQGGRAVIEEAVDYPDGTELEVVVINPEEADPFSHLEPEEREKLHAVLAQSRSEHEAGLGIPMEEALARLRSR